MDEEFFSSLNSLFILLEYTLNVYIRTRVNLFDLISQVQLINPIFNL